MLRPKSAAESAITAWVAATFAPRPILFRLPLPLAFRVATFDTRLLGVLGALARWRFGVARLGSLTRTETAALLSIASRFESLRRPKALSRLNAIARLDALRVLGALPWLEGLARRIFLGT